MHCSLPQLRAHYPQQYVFCWTSANLSAELQQYWIGRAPWDYVPVTTFAEAFQKHKTGRRSAEDLAVPFEQTAGSKDALVDKKYSLSSRQLLSTSEVSTDSSANLSTQYEGRSVFSADADWLRLRLPMSGQHLQAVMRQSSHNAVN